MAPTRLSFEQLVSGEIGDAVVVAAPHIDAGFLAELPFPMVGDIGDLRSGHEWVIVVGGGTLIDEVKYEVREHLPGTKLIAIPSLWGSGAHVSPVVVLNSFEKQIHFDEKYVPDAFVLAPVLGKTVSPSLAKYSCGDVWSHALEGFLSPLATRQLREEASGILSRLLNLPLTFHADWFEFSGPACSVQARSSVGLVHGVAHVMEPVLARSNPGEWGHARLCSTFLYPVMCYNMSRSDKVQSLCAQFSVDLSLVLEKLKEVFEPGGYEQAIAQAIPWWDRIARDRCSRTNCVLVRREGLEFFKNFAVECAESR